MSRLQKVHVASAGTCAVIGGALLGTVGYFLVGPPWLVAGVVVGVAVGALLGHRFAEAADSRGDLGHFQQIYRQTEYYVDGMTWDDYAPAYRLALDGYERRARDPDMAGAELEARWASARGSSRLSWQQAYPAIQHAWRELAECERSPRAA